MWPGVRQNIESVVGISTQLYSRLAPCPGKRLQAPHSVLTSRMQSQTLLAVLSAAILFQSTNALNACPGTDTVFTGTQGIRYRVCPGTDLTGPTVSVTPKVASVAACAKLCDKSMDCFKAVYDTRTKDCHFKEIAGLNWVANDRYQVVQAEQVNIARCPAGEWTYGRNKVSSREKLRCDITC